MRIQIQLRAQNLKNAAGVFKGVSDPYAKVKLASNDEVIGETKSVKNCLNPEWIEPIYLQNLNDTHILVEVWDDNRGKEEDVLMGKTLVNIKEALEQPEITKDEELDGGGILKVHVVPSRKTSTSLVFQFRCLDVKNIESGMLGFGKTDPYVEIAKVYNYPDIGTKHVQAVYRSEVIPNHLNPFYEKAAINFEELCDGDQNMPLLISIWDYSSRKRTLVGALETDTENLLAAVAEGNGDKSRALRFVTMGFRKTHVVAHLVVLEARLIDE